MKRLCKICEATPASAPFYKGVNMRCAACHRKMVSKNRREKIAYYTAYEAKRYQTQPQRKELNKRYSQTPNGKAVNIKCKKEWQKKNGEKRAAHVKLNNALRDGKITRPKICTVCHAVNVPIQGHHFDYSRPLDVIWCCVQCHSDLHKKERRHGRFALQDAA